MVIAWTRNSFHHLQTPMASKVLPSRLPRRVGKFGGSCIYSPPPFACATKTQQNNRKQHRCHVTHQYQASRSKKWRRKWVEDFLVRSKVGLLRLVKGCVQFLHPQALFLCHHKTWNHAWQTRGLAGSGVDEDQTNFIEIDGGVIAPGASQNILNAIKWMKWISMECPSTF